MFFRQDIDFIQDIISRFQVLSQVDIQGGLSDHLSDDSGGGRGGGKNR
jgi:hypothetical protein